MGVMSTKIDLPFSSVRRRQPHASGPQGHSFLFFMILSACCLARQTCRDETEIWRDGGEIQARCDRDKTEMEAR